MPASRWLSAGVVLTLAAVPAPGGGAGADAVRPQAVVPLFNGKDLSGWKIPEGDNGHWKVVDGVIDYDAASEAKGSKDLMTEKEFGDFELRVEWRIKETPYINPNVPYILPDGSQARDSKGKPMKMSLPDSDSGIILRGDVLGRDYDRRNRVWNDDDDDDDDDNGRGRRGWDDDDDDGDDDDDD